MSLLAWALVGVVWFVYRFYRREADQNFATDNNVLGFFVFFAILWMGSSFFIINIIFDKTLALQRLSYFWTLIFRTIAMITVVLLNYTLTALFLSLNSDLSFLQEFSLLVLNNPETIKYGLFVVYMSIVYNAILQFQKILGIKMALSVLLGTYRKPKDEQYILIFISIKDFSNTEEKLGIKTLFKYLVECCNTLEKSISKFGGNIYTLIDHNIIYWKVQNGIRDNNFINAIFYFLSQIEKQERFFKANFGLVPSFKVGIDSGTVTIYETGSEKRKICMIGNALNIASRLQNVVTDDETDAKRKTKDNVFISAQAFEQISSLPDYLTTHSLGTPTIQGLKDKIQVYKLTRARL